MKRAARPLAALFFIFSSAVFQAAPQLTERLEEAKQEENTENPT